MSYIYIEMFPPSQVSAHDDGSTSFYRNFVRVCTTMRQRIVEDYNLNSGKYMQNLLDFTLSSGL